MFCALNFMWSCIALCKLPPVLKALGSRLSSLGLASLSWNLLGWNKKASPIRSLSQVIRLVTLFDDWPYVELGTPSPLRWVRQSILLPGARSLIVLPSCSCWTFVSTSTYANDGSLNLV